MPSRAFHAVTEIENSRKQIKERLWCEFTTSSFWKEPYLLNKEGNKSSSPVDVFLVKSQTQQNELDKWVRDRAIWTYKLTVQKDKFCLGWDFWESCSRTRREVTSIKQLRETSMYWNLQRKLCFSWSQNRDSVKGHSTAAKMLNAIKYTWIISNMLFTAKAEAQT